MGRGGSQFDEINMCYLLSEDQWDRSTLNFYIATSFYIHNLITYLPSKNTVLSKEMIDYFSENRENMEEYIKELHELCDNPACIREIVDCYLTNTNKVDGKFQNLLNFCYDQELELEMNETEEKLKKKIKDRLKELEVAGKSEKDWEISKVILEKVTQDIGNKIFYCTVQNIEWNNEFLEKFETNIDTLDAVSECGRYISENTNYIEYKKEFDKNIRVPLLFHKYEKIVNPYFEEYFIENCFEKIFPGELEKTKERVYYDVLKDIFEKEKSEIDGEDKKILLEHCDEFVKTLPFFRMCEHYKKILKKL